MFPSFYFLNTVKCNLMEWTTERVCVPLRVCGIVMHVHQYIRLCQCSSCLPVFCLAVVPVHPAGVCNPLHFCFVCLCTCTIECVELALVNLCSQRSSVVHMCVDPLCLLTNTILHLSIVSGLFPTPTSLVSTVYIISVTGALLTFCLRARGFNNSRVVGRSACS